MRKSNKSHNLSVISKDKVDGITLISLIITIIVLLILAEVSIATLTGECGLITNTSKAKDVKGINNGFPILKIE